MDKKHSNCSPQYLLWKVRNACGSSENAGSGCGVQGQQKTKNNNNNNSQCHSHDHNHNHNHNNTAELKSKNRKWLNTLKIDKDKAIIIDNR